MSNKDCENKNRELQPYQGSLVKNFDDYESKNEESGNIVDDENEYNQDESTSEDVYETQNVELNKTKPEIKKGKKNLIKFSFIFLVVVLFVWLKDGKPIIFYYMESLFFNKPKFTESYIKQYRVPSSVIPYIDYNEFEKALLTSDLDIINKTIPFLENNKELIKDYYDAMKTSISREKLSSNSFKLKELKKFEKEYKNNDYAIDNRLSRLKKRKSILESTLEIKNIKNFDNLSEVDLISEVNYFVSGKYRYYNGEIEITKEQVIDKFISLSVNKNFVKLLDEVLTKIVDNLHNINTYAPHAKVALKNRFIDCFDVFAAHGFNRIKIIKYDDENNNNLLKK